MNWTLKRSKVAFFLSSSLECWCKSQSQSSTWMKTTKKKKKVKEKKNYFCLCYVVLLLLLWLEGSVVWRDSIIVSFALFFSSLLACSSSSLSLSSFFFSLFFVTIFWPLFVGDLFLPIYHVIYILLGIFFLFLDDCIRIDLYRLSTPVFFSNNLQLIFIFV